MTGDAKSRLSAALQGRYRVERELGAGGMATVYLAHDVKHDRKVAVKVLRAELAAVIGADRFLAEIKTTANLQHPHILPLHDSGEVDGTVFYVMPLVEGESLRNRLDREKQLPVDDAVRIVREVSSALDYAHRHGVIHRDIKPENILLHDGQALVADFGIALAASNAGGTRMTETGMSLGTPHYMSPEQAMGERTIDARTDVYSLGAVLYELLTGEPPHSGSTVQAIVAKVLSEPPVPITRTRSLVPPNVDAAVQRALAKAPADRFASAADFSAALGNAAYTLPAFATPGVAPTRASVWNPVSIAATAAAAVLLAALLWSPRGQQSGASSAGVTRQRIVLNVSRNASLGLSTSIAPDGSAIVFVAEDSAMFRLMLKRRDQIDPTPVSGAEGAVSAAISPDGAWIAFVSGGKLKKVPILGGTPLTLSDSVNATAPSQSWLNDSTIAFTSPTFGVMAVSATGGVAPRELARVSDTAIGRSIIAVSAIPGTNGLLLTGCLTISTCSPSTVLLFDTETRTSTVIATDGLRAWYVNSGHIVYVRRDGAALAVPFDRDRLAVTGTAIPVFDGVRVSLGIPDMAVAASGTVLYEAGEALANDLFQPVWVTRDGRVSVIDSAWSYVPGPNAGIALSPDGTHLATAEQGAFNGDIWIKRLDRGAHTRLTTEGSRNFRPEWSTDSRSVTFLSDRVSGAYDLYRARADGSAPPEVVLDLADRITEALPSRDGRWFVLRTGGFGGQAGGRRLAALRVGVDSAPTTIFSNTQSDAKAVALSPDGRWLAYESTESGSEQVFIRPFPNTGESKLQVSARGGFGPLWSRSGRELFYLNGALQMVVVSVRVNGSSITTSDETVLFPTAGEYYRSINHRSYDISPDDRRFVLLRSLSRPDLRPGAQNLILVENWLEELRALAGR